MSKDKHKEFWIDVSERKVNDWEGASINFTDMKRKGQWSQRLSFWLSDIYLRPDEWELRRKQSIMVAEEKPPSKKIFVFN
jgi:hypothetical protein